MMTRRQAILGTVLAGFAASATNRTAWAQTPPTAQPIAPATGVPPTPTGPFAVPPLPYGYAALEPCIDAWTMRLHHDKHHATYVANLNKAVAAFPGLQTKSPEDLLKGLDALPESVRTAVRNNAGGHYNHSLFWQMMRPPTAGNAPAGALADAISRKFASQASFQDQFSKEALARFGSGWVWLTSAPDGALAVESTANQDSPLSQGRTPLLGLDVWEHSYYIKYNNRRAEYVAAFYQLINWDFVADRYKQFKAA